MPLSAQTFDKPAVPVSKNPGRLVRDSCNCKTKWMKSQGTRRRNSRPEAGWLIELGLHEGNQSHTSCSRSPHISSYFTWPAYRFSRFLSTASDYLRLIPQLCMHPLHCFACVPALTSAENAALPHIDIIRSTYGEKIKIQPFSGTAFFSTQNAITNPPRRRRRRRRSTTARHSSTSAKEVLRHRPRSLPPTTSTHNRSITSKQRHHARTSATWPFPNPTKPVHRTPSNQQRRKTTSQPITHIRRSSTSPSRPRNASLSLLIDLLRRLVPETFPPNPISFPNPPSNSLFPHWSWWRWQLSQSDSRG